MNKISGDNFKNKKVLVFGLGLLGGGVATTNWLLKHVAKVTITDLKSEDYLEPSLRRLKGKPKLRLNGHDKKDIEDNEVIVFNPDVSVKNPFVKYARQIGRQVENEATIFYKFCQKPIIAVTGTRGKTTTANWTGHFLNGRFKSVVAGNSYVKPLLKTLDGVNNFSIVVNEIPSYHLEFFDSSIESPVIAVITNVFRDHLNRHASFEEYAITKGNIFKNQTEKQHLILNYNNRWTKFFLKQKPRSTVWLFSVKKLPQKYRGVFHKGGNAYFQMDGRAEKVLDVRGFAVKWGEHNLENLLASSLAAHLSGVPWREIQQKIKTLPQIPFRQEIIFAGKELKIINDTSATSPDGGIAAIKRFGGGNCVLIAGGTDRNLDFKEWAKVVSRTLKTQNVILLAGSATDKMFKALGKFALKINVHKSLKECLEAALARTARTGRYSKSVVVFSPAAKSFEKFKNEFDRGRQFNNVVRKELKNGRYSF